MSKVTGTLLVGLAARRAYLSVLNDTETGIKDSTRNWLVTLVVLVGHDIDYALLKDFLRTPDPELDSDDLVTHACALLSLVSI